MDYDLQKGSVWKRFAAWLLDAILLSVIAVGAAYLISAAFGYDDYQNTFQSAYIYYENQYGVDFDIPDEAFAAMTEQELQLYNDAYRAMISDEEVTHAYNMVVNLSLLVATFGILLGVLLLEFLVPLILGNGQTVGKKAFSLAVVRIDSVRVTALQMFIRAILGKFTIETMIPVYIILMIFWGIVGAGGTLVLGFLLVVQLVILVASRSNALIHDLLAGTAVVDISSQMIFKNVQARIDYQKKIHADQAGRQAY